MNTDEILKKIENMSAAELSKLFCEALDEAGVKYEIGECNITGFELEIDDNLAQKENTEI